MNTKPELTRESFLSNPSGQVIHRSFLIKREAVDVEARTVELAFSSEAPVERYFGIEVLDHSPASVDLARIRNGGPVLKDHDPCEQVGVVESASIGADRVGRAVVRFGKGEDADEVFQDIVDGIRRHVSVGYRIHKVEVSDPESANPTYRATLWEPYEISMVSIPADTSVGVGRSFEQPIPPAAEIPAPAPHIEVRSNAMTDQIDVVAIEQRAQKTELARVQEMLTLGDQYKEHGGQDVVARALREGKDARWVTDEILRGIAAKANASPSAPDVGMTDKEVRQYSMLKAINAMVLEREGKRDAWAGAGLEREAHDALLKRGVEAKNGGVLIPYEVQKRDMSTAANGGGYLVATDNLAGSFIDLLRNRSVLGQLGATMLSGLKGNITIPKLTAGATAYWLSSETTAITESNQTIGQLAMSPKNVGAYTEISRQLMLQSSPSADMLVMGDLAKVLALGIDLAGLEGSGSSGQPSGISVTSGIGSFTGTSLDYAALLNAQADVAAANALTPGCAYVTTPTVASLLAARTRFSSTNTPLWDGNLLDANVVGYRGMTTNAVTAATAIFGDFSQVIIGEWGTLELALNPYASFTAGIVGVRAFQSVDIGIRIAGAFSRSTSIT